MEDVDKEGPNGQNFKLTVGLRVLLELHCKYTRLAFRNVERRKG